MNLQLRLHVKSFTSRFQIALFHRDQSMLPDFENKKMRSVLTKLVFLVHFCLQIAFCNDFALQVAVQLEKLWKLEWKSCPDCEG